jgi:hypothetical protein
MNSTKMNCIKIEPMYETEEGLEFIGNPNDSDFINKQCDLGKFKMAFHIQTVDCAAIYAVFNNAEWALNYHLYKFMTLISNTQKEMYDQLIEGRFDIGIARLGSYHVIKDIKPYFHEDNDELRLHYTEPRTHEKNIACRTQKNNAWQTQQNIAWRSITWDAFKDIVDKLNEDNEFNEDSE